MPGDLHTHTTYSDGSTPVAKLPFLARCAGMTHLAISDHDSIQSVRYAYAHPGPAHPAAGPFYYGILPL